MATNAQLQPPGCTSWSAVALHRSPAAFPVDSGEAAEIALQVVGKGERYRRVRFFLDALTE
jgi:hypothetical protein